MANYVEEVTFEAFDTPLQGVCSICIRRDCGADGWVRPRFRGERMPDQIGWRCADKIAAAFLKIKQGVPA
jgi:hypothetical protein